MVSVILGISQCRRGQFGEGILCRKPATRGNEDNRGLGINIRTLAQRLAGLTRPFWQRLDLRSAIGQSLTKCLQNRADGIQYFARQLAIRGGACQRHRSDERTLCQDRLRSGRTLVLSRP
jgi:hypothetical protein